MRSSGQCAYPSDLDFERTKNAAASRSGQCAYPSDLDYSQYKPCRIRVPASAHIPVI